MIKELVFLGICARNLQRIAKSLATLAETQQLALKLKLIQADITLEALKEATAEIEDTSNTVDTETDEFLEKIQSLEIAFHKRFGYQAPDDLSLAELESIMENP